MNKKIIILIMLIILLTGCTKRFTVKESDNSTKTYVSNIMCKPKSEKTIKIYEENEEKILVNIEELPNCEDFKINSGKYEGLWTSFFVKPLSWLIIKLGLLVKNYGISIMILGFILRAAMFPLSKKSLNMSTNLQKAQKELDTLEKKYKGKDDKDSMIMKSQEMMLIYKKHNISPFSGCLVAFLQMPIFFAFLEAIYRIPAFFEEQLWKFNLGTTPIEGFKMGNYYYVILIVLIAVATYFSFKNMNTSISIDSQQEKQQQMMTKFMMVFIIFASFSLPTAIALYWIVSNGFTILQNIILKKGKV